MSGAEPFFALLPFGKNFDTIAQIKNIALSMLSLVFLAAKLSALPVRFFTPTPRWTAVHALHTAHGSDGSLSSAGAEVAAALDFRELRVSSGILVRPSVFDFTVDAVYMPTIAGRFGAGVGSVLHVNAYADVFSEVDFLTGAYFQYEPSEAFGMNVNISYFYKEARIRAAVPPIYNHNIAVMTKAHFRPVKPLTLDIGLSSYAPYRYLLFFAPVVTVGGEYTFSDFIALGGSARVRYIDAFTLSANFDGFDTRFFLKFSF